MRLTTVLFFLLFALSSFGAGTVTVTKTTKSFFSGVSRYVQVVQIDWTADSADGSVPDTNIVLSGWVQKAITDPGGTAPTANYDIALKDPQDSALDALANALQNRHTSTTEQVYPMIAGSPGTVTSRSVFLPPGTYTFSLSNNSVNSATGRVLLYLTDTP